MYEFNSSFMNCYDFYCIFLLRDSVISFVYEILYVDSFNKPQMTITIFDRFDGRKWGSSQDPLCNRGILVCIGVEEIQNIRKISPKTRLNLL